jgi:hypothetical protein
LSAFRVFRAKLREAFADCQSPFVSIDVLLTWATTRFGAVAVVLPPRDSGQTTPADTAIIHALGIARVSLMHSLLNFIFDFRAPHVLCDHAVR